MTLFTRDQVRKVLNTNVTPPILRHLRSTPFVARWLRRASGLRRFHRITTVYNMIHSIVRANQSLPEGLRHAALDAPDKRTRLVLSQLAERMEHGDSLSEAMQSAPDFFPELHADLVAAGEQSGSILESLDRIMEDMIGPAGGKYISTGEPFYLLSSVISLAIVGAFVIVKVVPVFGEIITDMSAQPSRTLGWLLALNRSTSEYVGDLAIVGIFCLILVFFTIVFWRNATFWTLRSLVLLHLPFLGRWFQKQQLSTVALITGRLVEGGIPLPDAIRRASKIDISPVFAKALSAVAESIEQGVPLTVALARHKRVFSQGFRAQVSLGESSGMLADALVRTSEQYKNDVVAAQLMFYDGLQIAAVVPLAALVLILASAIFGAQIDVGQAIMDEL